MSVGEKHDSEKIRYDLLPFEAVDEVVKVLTFGAEKYAADNWKSVEDGERRYIAAALRHISAHQRGELIDAESGLSHLAHATTCMVFLLSGELTGRPSRVSNTCSGTFVEVT